MEHGHEQENGQAFGFVAGLVLGAVIGAGVALLVAPETGRKTRKRLKRAAVGIRNSAADRLDDLAEEMKGKVDEVMKGARAKLVS